MEAISSLLPRTSDAASMEPPSEREYTDSLTSQLMCCESFTVPRIEPLVEVRPVLPAGTDSNDSIDVADGVLTATGGHTYEQDSLHVEVLQHSCSSLSASVVRDYAVEQLKRQPTAFGEFTLSEFDDPVLKEHVVSISVCDVPCSVQFLDVSTMHLKVHVYRLHDDGPVSEELDEDCDVSAANHWILPSTEFHGLWEQLVYDVGVKQELLDYAETTLLFSDRGVDSNVISWNRVVLLHGPPGTGKTSLCKALSHKLAIRLSQRYSYGQLIEINSHSLFSKWFSESGKLVQKMFHKIQELIDDPEIIVCVLIDEVESLTAARKSAMSGSEPSDAIRVVNALLTQLDQIRRYPNVLILTTSNVTGAIDLAFVDRADVKQYIGLPSPAAIFKIYHSCLTELMRVGIIHPHRQILDLRALEIMRFTESEATRLSLKLREVARRSEGLSGRTLRKIPFLAHALFAKYFEPFLLQRLNENKSLFKDGVYFTAIAKSQIMTLEEYLDTLNKAVQKQFAERKQLNE